MNQASSTAWTNRIGNSKDLQELALVPGHFMGKRMAEPATYKLCMFSCACSDAANRIRHPIYVSSAASICALSASRITTRIGIQIGKQSK